jgi:hypothetical protein
MKEEGFIVIELSSNPHEQALARLAKLRETPTSHDPSIPHSTPDEGIHYWTTIVRQRIQGQ